MANALLNRRPLDYEDYQEDTPGLWRRLGSTALSGVAAAGNFLDIPGSMVRDIAGFENPLDNLLHPFSGVNRLSGRDLLRKHGLIGQEDTYANFGAGLGAEIALDPLTWTGVGGLLKAGGATAGKGLIRASVPFTKTGTELFTGPASQQFAKGLGTALEATYKPSVLAPQLEKAADYLPAWMRGKGAAATGEPMAAAAMSAEDSANAKYLQDWLASTPSSHEGYLQHLTEYEQLTGRGRNPLTRAASEAASGAPPSTGDSWAQTAADVLTAPARTIGGLFSPSARGKFDEFGQNLAAAQHARLPEAVRAARETVTGFADDFKQIHNAFTDTYGPDLLKDLPKELAEKSGNVEHHLHNKFESWINHAAETDLPDAFQQLGIPAEKFGHELTQKTNGLLDTMKGANKTGYSDYLEMGGKGHVMEDLEAANEGVTGMNYVPRAAAYSFNSLKSLLAGLSTRPAHSLARDEAARYVPKLILEKIAHDDLARGIIPDEMTAAFKAAGVPEEHFTAHAINEKYGQYLNKETTAAVDANGKAIQVPKWNPTGETPLAHASELASWAKKRQPYQVYQNDLLGVEGRYHNAVNIARANVAAIHDMVLKHGGPMDIVPDEAGKLMGMRDFTQSTRGQNIVGLPEVYKLAGMDVEKSLKYVARKLGHSAEEIADPEKWKALRAELNLKGVPEDIASAIHSAREVPNNPEWLDHIKQLADIPTSFFKQNVTLPFAAFAARNSTSGHYMNVAGGDIKSFGDLQSYGGLVKQHFDDWKSGKITPEQEREWFTNGVLSGDTHFEGVQYRHPEFGKVLPDNPLQVKKSFLEAGQDIAPTELDKVPGLRTARQVHGTVLTTGAKANGLVEFLNRVPMYEYLKSKGWSPQEAAQRVLELQVEYSPHAYSPFENEVMRRAIPFYSYQRKIAPVILKTLAMHPTGVMGQTIRASRLAGSDDPTTPSWIADTLAVPLGGTAEGGQSYLTGLGLPYEQPLAYLGGGVRGAGREFLSQLNPLIKAPLEWSVGQSLFQTGPNGAGRPLDEVNPPIGQTLANVASLVGRDASNPVKLPAGLEFIAANSPASRFISTARQLTDVRKSVAGKAVNALTGLRIANVSPAAADNALQGRVDAMLRQSGARRLEEVYIPANRKESLPPETRELIDQLTELKKLLGKRRRERQLAQK